MSIAKKSFTWLIAAILAFALILTVSLVVGNSAMAKADEDNYVDADVIVVATSTLNTSATVENVYPNLLKNTTEGRTITAKYYFATPTGGNGVFFVAPALKHGNATILPTAVNNGLATADTVRLADYLAGDDTLIAFTTGSNLVSGINAGAVSSGNFLFEATYVIAADEEGETVGKYDFVLGSADDGVEFSVDTASGNIYNPVIVDGGVFHVRTTVEKPVAVAGLVYNGSDVPQIGVTQGDQNHSALMDGDTWLVDEYALADQVNGYIGAINAGDYSTEFALTDPDNVCWANNTTENYTVEWSIAKLPIAIPTAGSETYTFTANGDGIVEQTYAFGSEVDTTYVALANNVQSLPDTYTVTANLVDTDNTMWVGGGAAEQTYSFVIAVRTIALPEITAGANVYTYNGSEKEFQFTVDPVAYYTAASNVAKTTVGTYTPAVELVYPSYTTWVGGGNGTISFTDEFVINPALVTVPTPADVTYYFNNTPQSFQWAETPDELITITGTPQTNAGEYTITASIPANYAWDDEGNTTADKTFSFVINKKSVAVPVAETEHFTYDGTEKSFSYVQTVADDGYIKNINSGSTWLATYAGNYSVKVGLEYPANTYWGNDQNDVADKTIPWYIDRKVINKPSISVSSGPYTGVEKIYSQQGVGYSFTGSGTDVGNYPITLTLDDKANTIWNDETTDDYQEAAKLVIYARTVHLDLSVSAESSVYGQQVATITVTTREGELINADDIGTISYTATHFQNNTVYTKAQFESTSPAPVVGNYIIDTVNSIDNPNYSIQNSSYPYEITKVQVTIPVLSSETTSFVYNFSTQGISFTQASLADSSLFTFTGDATATNVGNYTRTATLNDSTNYEWADNTTAAKNYNWSITTRYIPVPVVEQDTFPYDGNSHSILFSSTTDDSYWYVSPNPSESAIGTYPATVQFYEYYGTNVAWDEAGYPTEAKNYTLTIEVVQVKITFVGVYGDVEKTLAEEVELDVFAELPTYDLRWFRFEGYTFDNATVTTAALAMDGETVYASYIYNVGAGDVDGDGFVTTNDILTMRRNYGKTNANNANGLATAAAAWAKVDDTSFTTPIHYLALDVNNSGAFRSNDIVAIREALATGYDYKIIDNSLALMEDDEEITAGVSGQAVIRSTIKDVSDYATFKAYVKAGYAVRLITDISAATETFDEDLNLPVNINLNGNRLTVKGFTLNSDVADVTLKIKGGTLYTVNGISVTAPNGNVKVADVNGYSYDGTNVVLSAYSESLHIDGDVAFYIYHVKDANDEPVSLSDFNETVVADEGLDTLADTRIQDTADRMAEIAAIKANENLDETEKAEAINAKEVKKAIIEVPVDTHVVVEEAASLSVDKLVVKAQSDENAPVVTTFAIEVKNSAAEVVTVDITEVKTIETVDYYVVEEVAISGASSQVEIVSGDNTAAEVKKYVAQIGSTNYETLQAAINAAAYGDTIKLIADVADGTGLKTADNNSQDTKVGKAFTIDFNGKTYTVDGAGVGSTNTETQAMHWGEKDNITLKNGSIVISVKGATVPNPSNNKIIKMAMQNYADLTVKNMTLDFSNIVVRNYGDYTGDPNYEAYSFLEIPLFNLNKGSMTIEDSTITFPNDSTKGVLIEIPDAATIKNSTINGYVSLGQFDSNVTIVNSTTSGVVSYFAGYGVKHSGNVYRLGGVSVTNATELQAALDAGALIIDVENDFNAPNPIAVSKSTIINGYNHTITSAGNRIMNVTEAGVVLTINDLTMTSATSERGLNIWNNATDTDITLNNVTIDAHLYAINYVNGADNERLTINNSSITGWAAINAHFNNSTVVVNNSTLYGINRDCDHVYGFSTVVIDGDSLHGSQEGDHGVDNSFVFDGCTIIAEVTLTHQYWISFQYAATGNEARVVVNNCQILDAPNGIDKSADMKIDGTNNAVVMALSAEQYAIVAAKHFNITDNGDGTYTIAPKIQNISYFGTAYNFYDVFENGWLEDTEAFTLTDDVVLDTDVVFARNRDAAIAVSGGTFEMNLDGNTISGVGKILLPVGVTCVTDSDVSIAGIFEAPEGEVIIESVDADGNYIYAVGKAYVKTEAEFTAALAAGAKYIILNADIEVTETIVVDYATVLDMNGKTLYNVDDLWDKKEGDWSIISVRTEDGDLTIIGDGTISAKENDCYTIDVKNGATLDIEDGTYIGNVSVVYICGGGHVTINGGEYSLLQLYPDERFLLNCLDADYKAGTANFTVNGGTFHGFNPADNASEGAHTNYLADGYVAVEEGGVWTVVPNEIEITTFAELKAAIADVNAGTRVNPTLIIANDIAFEEELTISKSVYIKGDGSVKFIGYDASTKYDEAFFINVADEDQEITIDGIVFDHFCYYSNVANKTKATADAVKNGVAYITYGGDCPASTTLYITDCRFIGTARDMINASSTKGCKGFIVIEDCYFDATERLSSTLNMLSFYGNADAELYVSISGCTFKEASEQNATWATSAIASFGNTDLTVAGCEFIACQIGIAIDNTFDRLYSTSTYPVTVNTICTINDVTYVNCYYGYYEESVFASVDEVPEGAELYTDEPFTYGSNAATQFSLAAEYDLVVAGTQGVDAKYLVLACYYIAA